MRKTISHYRVLEKIGAGGMGVVYRAHDEQLDRDVALKVLPAGMLAEENARKRFRREALALAKLNHPNVGAVYEFGSEDGIDFLVMELITGVTLDTRLGAGPLAEKEVLRLGTQLADGLQAAHAQGIIHRDLKPGNLRLTGDERLKILDFGLAQYTPAEPDAAQTETNTKAHEVSGTLPYMSPEQLRGQKADARTDVYSAGAVLYEMATGKRPFANSSGPQLIGAILEQAPAPPSTHNRQVSVALESIILKALDKDANRRYQTARELHIDLERLSSGRVPTARRRRLSWGWIAAMVLVAVAVFVGLNFRGWRERGSIKTSQPSGAIKSRRSVAVLGFKNLSGKPEQAWISTALAEMLTTELAAGEQLRTVPGENVARMKMDLSLTDADSFGRETLQRIRTHLGSDLVIEGSYLALGKESGGRIRLDYRLQDAAAGETIATVSETGTEGELLDLVSRTGAELRRRLGVGAVSVADAPGVKASLPANAEAARLYSQGLAKLRVFEALQARALLERAVAADPKHAPSHSALADAWAALGYDIKAQAEAKQAFDLSENLSREEKLFVQGRYRELTHDWPKTVEIYETLRAFFPDNLEYGLRLATAQVSAGQGKDALATIEGLSQLPPPQVDDARIDLAESKAAASTGDFKRAQESGARAATKGRTQGARLIVAQARMAEGWALERLGQPDKAMAAFAEARELFADEGDRFGAALAVHQTGNVLYDKGDFAGARKSYEDALVVFRQLGTRQRESSSLNNVGNVLYDQGDLAQARKYYEQVLSLARELGDKSSLAGALGNTANVLDALGELAAALKLNEEGLAVFREIGDKRGTGSTLNNMANLRMEMGDLKGSQQTYAEALAIEQETGYKRGLAYTQYGSADGLLAQGKLEEARALSESTLAMRKEMGDENNLALSQIQLAGIYVEQGRLAEAERLAREATALLDKIKAVENRAAAYASLSQVLLQEGKTAEAASSADRAVTLSLQSGSRWPRFEATLAAARVDAASGKNAQAVKKLEAMLGEAKKDGFRGYEYEARLALGKIEMKSSNTAAGRARLDALQKDATGSGYLLVAEKARRARE